MTAFIMKRSIWASGRLNVPSSSIGFCVADDHERFGQFDPLAADGGGALRHGLQHRRLGFGVGTVDLVEQHEVRVDRPICVAKRWDAKSKTCVPTRSEGMRSGVHCTRLNVPDTAVASVCAAVVLARPGTDSMRIWPPATSVTISDSRRLSWPTRVWANRARSRSAS